MPITKTGLSLTLSPPPQYKKSPGKTVLDRLYANPESRRHIEQYYGVPEGFILPVDGTAKPRITNRNKV